VGRSFHASEEVEGERGEKGWQVDAKGRLYRDEAGSRRYKNRTDRDSAVEERYELSPAMQSILAPGHGGVFAEIAANTTVLAEVFHREAATMRNVGTLDERIELWCRHHFGAQLEPALAGMLRYAIRRTLALGQGGITGPVCGVFRDYSEQRAFEHAAEDQAAPRITDSLRHCRRIAEAAGVKCGDGPYDMPRVPGQEG
jgi:hypothetical protein